jgi:predicted metalloprotease with PDZ domain
MKKYQIICFRAVFLVLSLAIAATASAQSTISLAVDASDVARGIIHVEEKISVTPGRIALFYPKWIPGEHSPTGPINNMVDFKVSANGKPLAWNRDNVEMFAFWVDVPRGVRTLDVAFDDVADPGTTNSASLARIKWNRLLVYQRGVTQNRISVTATLKVPAGWDQATALPLKSETAPTYSFVPVDLEQFIDSPAIIGRYFKKVPLSAGGTLHEMDIAADAAEALNYSADTLAGWRNLVIQAERTFGGHHYNSYRFLLTLSDVGGSEGLEHHQSSEDGVGLNSFRSGEPLLALGDLLGHEFTHSWNGKFRRPAGLATPDFEKPQEGELLWVYEGLTEYMGYVLPARAGLWTADEFRETLASDAAMMAQQRGRNWRPVVDTARAVQFTYPSPRGWRNTRRGVDYYYEGGLVWLEADVMIRKGTNGRKSLDDFLHDFHGGISGPVVKPYTFNDVVASLNRVMPYDWATFLRERIYQVRPDAPTGGITNGGWRLDYSPVPNVRLGGSERERSYRNYFYSLGLYVADSGAISDVQPDSPAARAGLAPGMKILGRGGKPFSNDDLASVITAAATSPLPISLQVENGGVVGNYSMDYHGGLRYPHLVRVDGQPDIVSEIAKPKQ